MDYLFLLKLDSDLKNIPTFLNFRGQFRILLLIEFPFVYPVKNYQFIFIRLNTHRNFDYASKEKTCSEETKGEEENHRNSSRFNTS